MIEIELEECKFCIEDVKNVIFVVVEEGIVSGGGVVLVYLSKMIDEFKLIFINVEECLGVEIV